MIESLQGGYQTQSVTYTAQRTERRDPVQPVSSGDSVSLSGSGRLMSDFFAGIGVEPTSGGAVSLDDLKGALAQKRQALEDDVNGLFLESGIATEPPVNLTTDGQGRVLVQGDHPQKAEIEALFEGDPALSNDFRAVSGLSSLVEAGDEYSDFAAMYADDPYAAVARYGHLFNGSNGDAFSLTVDGPAATAPVATAPVDGSAMPVPQPDFANATRQEVMDWMNAELTSGRMTFEESIPFVSMTVKFDPEARETVDPATDTERVNFIDMAKGAIEGARYFGDEAAAQRYMQALEIMTG